MNVEFKLSETGKSVAVLFKYNPDLIEIARAIPNRRFDRDGRLSGYPKSWVFPATAHDLQAAFSLFGRENVKCGAEIEGLIDRARTSLAQSRATEAQISVPTKIEPYPFQKAGIQFVSDHGGRALIADEMGVGKSLQALGWTLVSQELPALVLCPANLRINWLREAKKFTNLRCLIISSKSSLKAFQRQGLDVSTQPENGYDLVIANYDLLSVSMEKGYLNESSVDDIMKMGFKTLICDEAHYLKEKTSQRSKAVLDLSSRMKNVLCLTGTPILNRPKEIWHLTRVVDPSIFPKFHDFGVRYCGAFKNRFGWVYDGASRLDELDKKLRSTIMIRRTKDQVLKELPPKTRVLMPFALESAQDRLYKKETSEAVQKLRSLKAERDQWRLETETLTKEELDELMSRSAEKKSRSAKLAGFMMEEIEKIRQACVRAKYDQCLSFIENLHGQEKKILIFAVHHETIDRLMADLSQKGIKVDRIDGRVDGAYRDGIKQRFQEGDLEVLVCGIRAAGEGLTLTASKSVVFMEIDYTPGRMVQAEDRTHRVGQSQAVTIYYLLLMGSIEEKIAALVDSKREVANAALGEGARTLSETGILDSILDEAIGNED